MGKRVGVCVHTYPQRRFCVRYSTYNHDYSGASMVCGWKAGRGGGGEGLPRISHLRHEKGLGGDEWIVSEWI